MIEFDKNPPEHLKENLETLALLKQQIRHIPRETFKVLEKESKLLQVNLVNRLKQWKMLWK